MPYTKRLIFGAPFGNYLSDPNAISTLGTFTAGFRAGPWKRAWRVLKTVRYYPGISAWKNKLGLPNPGIGWLLDKVQDYKIDIADKIVSISARRTTDWFNLLNYCATMRPAYVELNVSCPNCPGETDESEYQAVFKMAQSHFKNQAIVKLPPVGYMPIITMALNCDLTSFHCCNTLPTPGGGLSGAPLKMLSLQAIKDLVGMAGQTNLHMVIGGGGVLGKSDVHQYLSVGATHVSVASALFFPWRWPRFRTLAAELTYHNTDLLLR